LRSNGPRIALAVALLVVCLVLARHVAHDIPRIEAWVDGLGPAAPWAFALIVVVLTSIFIPDTVFALAAGVMFGLWRGTLIICAAGIIGAVLNFIFARRFLSGWVTRWLAGYPKLAAIASVADREGLRFHLLLRLTPVNPTTLSYILGAATRMRLSTFFIAAFGHIPGYFVEVYFGYVAAHVTKLAGGVKHHSTAHTVVNVVGLVISIVVMVYVTQRARAAIQAAELRDAVGAQELVSR
jgi:uncharacterized membrane protein YdjX (TVP38/TMEM64 family)